MEAFTNLPKSPKFVKGEQGARPFTTRRQAEERKNEIVDSIGAVNLSVRQVFANGTISFFVHLAEGESSYYLADE